MIAPNRIKFQKIFSNELNIPDLIMECAFDSDNSEVSTYLNRESVSVESYDGRRNNTIGYKYNERFSPRFTFMKNGFGDFDSYELRAVLKWLTSSDTPTLLDVYYDDSNVIEFSAIGNWTDISSYKLANSRTVAVVATFESIHPFALSDLYTATKIISSATDNKITIDIDTDDNKPVYPRIKINHRGAVVNIPEGTTLNALSDMVENTVYFNGTTYYWKTAPSTDEIYFNKSTTKPNIESTSIRLRNTHTDFFNVSKTFDAVVVKNNTNTEEIVLDGANKIVSSNSERRIFGDDFNLQWLELYDGKNTIAIEGNCEITLEWRTAIKCGEY